MAFHKTRYGWWYLPVTTTIQEVEAEVQDNSLLSTESEASRGYMRPCLKWRWGDCGGEGGGGKRKRDGLKWWGLDGKVRRFLAS